MKRFLTTALCIILAAVLMMGCKKDLGYDPNKTQIYVGNWNGGVGYAWLQAAKVAFERENPDLEIMIDNKKDEFNDGTLLAQMPYNRHDIYFLNSVSYVNYINSGIVEDITDVVTKKSYDEKGILLSEDEKVMSIADKINPKIDEFYNVGTESQPKYYGIPFFEAVYGLVYDKDLFDDYNFYDDGVGPDRLEGTYDDGLPETYEDFKALLSIMASNNVTPVTWSGMHEFYRNQFLLTVYAGYEGFENFSLNYTLNGYDSGLNLNIIPENAYLLQGQEGKKAALQVAFDIVNNDSYYSSGGYLTSQTHLHAQEEFLLSTRTSKPIAMIMEGGWWENESKDFFAEMTKSGQKYAYGTRRFGIMPFPRFEGTANIADQKNTGQSVFLSHGRSAVVVNKAGKNKELAKKFIEFIHSDDMLSSFTGITGVTRPYIYNLADSDRNRMTEFSRNVWDLTRDENIEIGYLAMSSNNMVLDNRSYMDEFNRFKTTVGGEVFKDPFWDFYFENRKVLTVNAYFNGFKNTYSQTNWNTQFSAYFN